MHTWQLELPSELSHVGNRTIVFNCSLHIVSDTLSDLMRDILALSLGLGGSIVEDLMEPIEFFRDYKPTLEFHAGVSQLDQDASARWLAAYIGNYVANCLGYLNEFLGRIENESGATTKSVTTHLVVKWERVGIILGGLALFQVLFGLAALLYCRRSVEIVFASGEERQQGNAVHQGKFVPEGDEVPVRWILVHHSWEMHRIPR